jgi:hypothetical protein
VPHDPHHVELIEIELFERALHAILQLVEPVEDERAERITFSGRVVLEAFTRRTEPTGRLGDLFGLAALGEQALAVMPLQHVRTALLILTHGRAGGLTLAPDREHR